MASKKKQPSLLQTMWPIWLAVGVLILGAALLIVLPMLGTRDEPVSLGQAVELPEPERNALLSAGIARGEANAPVTIYEFADYGCPACARFHATLAQIEEDYVAAGLVRLVFLDYPLGGVEGRTGLAAVAARCARRQNAFEAMQGRLFDEQRTWSERQNPVPDFQRYGREIGLDEARFNRCLDARATMPEVAQARSVGQRLGVRATPTVVVGGRLFGGAPNAASLRAAIEHELEAAAAP